MRESKRTFHKMRKWVCPKCGRVRMERKVKGKGGRSRRVASLAALGALLPVGGAWVASGPGFVVWAPSPLSRVFKDTRPPYKAPRDHIRVFVAAAKGEWESVQIAVHAPEGVEKLALRTGPLLGPGDVVLDEVRAWVVGYVPVRRNTPATPPEELERRAPAEFPDPLLPLEGPISIPKGESRAFFVTLHVPRDAPSGTYSGEWEVKGDGGGVRVSVILTVREFSLPGRSPLWVTNWFSPGNIAEACGVELWSEDFWRALERWGRDMAEHYQNVALVPRTLVEIRLLPDGSLSFDFSKFDRFVEVMERAGVVGRIEISHLGGRSGGWDSPFDFAPFPVIGPEGGPANLPKERVIGEFLRALQRHLEERGWLKRAMIHVADEPIEQNKDSYIRMAEFVRIHAPKLRRIEAIQVKDLTGHLEVWVPQLDYFARHYEHYKERQGKGGVELWFYTCCNPKGRFPNRFIDYPLLKTRILHWLNWRFGATGYLHWGWNHWPKGQAFTNVEPWDLPPGDSHIVYPGKCQPLPSLRWEAMRDGIEDYLYLWLLEEGARETLKALGVSEPKFPPGERADWLSRLAVPDFFGYVRSASELMALREAVAHEIEALKRGPLSVVDAKPLPGGGVLVRGHAEPGTEVACEGRGCKVGLDKTFQLRLPAKPGRKAVVVSLEKGGERKRVRLLLRLGR